MINFLVSNALTVITLTFATQYLIDMIKLDMHLTSLQKCQQDKLLLRQMILLDYQQAQHKTLVNYGTSFAIGENYYVLQRSSRNVFELYKSSPANVHKRRGEIISSQVKSLVIQQNSLWINFKHSQCAPLVIKYASKSSRQ